MDVLMLFSMVVYMSTSALMVFTLVYAIRNSEVLGFPKDPSMFTNSEKVIYSIFAVIFTVSVIGGFFILDKVFN